MKILIFNDIHYYDVCNKFSSVSRSFLQLNLEWIQMDNIPAHTLY